MTTVSTTTRNNAATSPTLQPIKKAEGQLKKDINCSSVLFKKIDNLTTPNSTHHDCIARWGKTGPSPNLRDYLDYNGNEIGSMSVGKIFL